MTVERVSSYPRPPRLEPSHEHILVKALGQTLVETTRSLRVLETFHPPTYYLPPEAMRFSSERSLPLFAFPRGGSRRKRTARACRSYELCVVLHASRSRSLALSEHRKL